MHSLILRSGIILVGIVASAGAQEPLRAQQGASPAVQGRIQLSEDDKQRIRAEEIFREEVRAAISKVSPERSRFGGIFAFLNSPFGLWVLSTVLVGFLSFSYRRWSERRDRGRLTQEIVRKLDIEISSRLRLAKDEAQQPNRRTFVEQESQYGFLSTFLLRPYENVFPENKNRGLLSLILELESVLPSSESGPVGRLVPIVERIESEYKDDSLMTNPAFFDSLSKRIDNELLLERWKKRE